MERGIARASKDCGGLGDRGFIAIDESLPSGGANLLLHYEARIVGDLQPGIIAAVLDGVFFRAGIRENQMAVAPILRSAGGGAFESGARDGESVAADPRGLH